MGTPHRGQVLHLGNAGQQVRLGDRQSCNRKGLLDQCSVAQTSLLEKRFKAALAPDARDRSDERVWPGCGLGDQAGVEERFEEADVLPVGFSFRFFAADQVGEREERKGSPTVGALFPPREEFRKWA